MSVPRYGDRVVIALNRSEDYLRALIAIDDKRRASGALSGLLPPDVRKGMIDLADECDFLAAQPLAKLIGGRGRRESV